MPRGAEKHLMNATSVGSHAWIAFEAGLSGVVTGVTSGGIFDASGNIVRTDPPGSDGTILLTFESCSSGMVEYDIPSINRQGMVPIQRVAGDNIVLCEALSTD